MPKRIIAFLATLAIAGAACQAGGTPTSGAGGSPAGSPGGSVAAPGSPGGSGPGSGETGAPGGSPPATGSDDFRFVVDGEPTSLAGTAEDLPTSWINLLTYNTLYETNNELEPVPDLADGMPEVSDDGLTWTVKLKSDVKFHDGTVMTADDVKYSYDLLLSPNCTQNPDACSSIQDNLESTTVSDPTTVVFQLKQRFSPFIVSGLGSPVIMPRAAIEASLGRFEENAAAVDAEAVSALAATISATQDAEQRPDCFPSAPPDGSSPPAAPEDCQLSYYSEQIKGHLALAQIQLPPEAGFQLAAEDGGGLDAEAYAQALLTQLLDLDEALGSEQIDKAAASLRLLDFARAPVGTGPYKFVKYTAAQSLEFARHEEYFGGDVGPARVFVPIIKDSATASAALQQGEIHWQQEIVSDALANIQQDPGLRVIQYPDFGYYFIAFNLREGRLYSDKNLRKAFSMCIDHEETVRVATEGQGVPVRANVPPASWAYNPDVTPYTLDVDGAKALIESSGWTLGSDGIYQKDGKRLSSVLYVREGRPQRVRFGELARDQLEACGIEIEVRPSDFSTVILPLIEYPTDFDMYLGGWNTSIDPDDASIFHSSHIVTQERPDDNNFPGWNNPEADRLLDAGQQELDQEKRKAIYREFQELINEDLPYYFLWSDLQSAGLSRRVTSPVLEADLQKPSKIFYWSMETWNVTAQ